MSKAGDEWGWCPWCGLDTNTYICLDCGATLEWDAEAEVVDGDWKVMSGWVLVSPGNPDKEMGDD